MWKSSENYKYSCSKTNLNVPYILGFQQKTNKNIIWLKNITISFQLENAVDSDFFKMWE